MSICELKMPGLICFWALFFADLALSTSGGTAIYAMSYPISGRWGIPHGVSNAILLP